MTTPFTVAELRESPTKQKLLRTLWWLTGQMIYPTATELAKQTDDRDNPPRATIHTRRNMIRDMRNAKLIEAFPSSDTEFDVLAITAAGIALIKELDAGGTE